MAKAAKPLSQARKPRKGKVVSAPASPPEKTIAANLKAAEKSRPAEATAALVLADGSTFWGLGFGAASQTVGEVCFNTSITGYQEILTDPSYAGQIITFTFPHIGNVGTNEEDIETGEPAARGLVVRAQVTDPSNWRADAHLDDWLKEKGLPGIAGVDTRALTARIRDLGAPAGALTHAPRGKIDIAALQARAAQWPGLDGMDLAREVTCTKTYHWQGGTWTLGAGYGPGPEPRFNVVAVDFGAKRNILRCLAQSGCRVTVVPATASAADILKHKPDGVFLSNGPGDPAATGEYAVPAIKEVLRSGLPVFGICLGHQLLALALGAKTRKMDIGHRGANHPVKDLETGKVEITSQNHGFVVLEDSLPQGVTKTHVSLFDGSLEGLRVDGKPVFSVQYHPEASPGPQDSHYLFHRFVELMERS
ncbi:MAG TPA: glutamine-hydrolyzing carbamoyl-phosphate synthase small subunit [Alphaproteobacteria bacterium]|nr:glutamine-hydrolyzing carbamoyl-phosphate synthase small subunit [Alphaproteobacteria bacterium]